MRSPEGEEQRALGRHEVVVQKEHGLRLDAVVGQVAVVEAVQPRLENLQHTESDSHSDSEYFIISQAEQLQTV